MTCLLRLVLRRWHTAQICLAVLLVVALQALESGTAWPQEAAQTRADDEITKQEKIYRSRGADVPSGYITGRALPEYAELLPSGFGDALGSLGSSDRWLDVGAGDGQAVLDYYASGDDALPVQKCSRLSGRARAVAMSIEDRRTDKWQQVAAALGDDHIQYLSGKRLREYSREELGKFQIITDVYGGFSYNEDLSLFMNKVLTALDLGGVFYTLLQGVRLENGKEKPDSRYQTELVDAAGNNVKVCSWLQQTSCVKVACESKSDWEAPTELIKVRKVCSDVSVRPTQLLKFEAGNPPRRQFQLDP